MFHFFYVLSYSILYLILYFILFCTLSYSVLYLILYFILFCILSYSVLYLILYFILFCTLSYSVLYPILYFILFYILIYAHSVFLFQSCWQVPFYCKFHFPIFRLFSIFIFIRSNGFRHPQTIHCRRENSARISRPFSTGIQSPYGRLQTVITKDSHRR